MALLLTLLSISFLARADVDGGISMSNPQDLPAADRDKEIDAGRHAGDWIRLPINWSGLQPADTTPVASWNWATYDAIINSARPSDGRKKLNVLVILGTIPGWANGNGGWAKPATDPATYQAYCREVAKRYLPLGVTAYQVGNEINLVHASDGWPTPTGGAYYTGFLLPGATGVWEASVSTGVGYNVVMGSLAPNTWNTASPTPQTFLTQVYTAAPANKRWLWGALAYHPYVGPAANPPSADANLGTTPTAVYNVMVANGESTKKLWATEFGSPTHGGQYVTSEAALAGWVDDVVAKWYSYSFAGPLFWYTCRDKADYNDPNTAISGERENYFGLLHHDYTAKSAYPVLKSYFNPAIENGKYKILARHSGKSLDVANWGTTNGTRVQQWTWHGGASQQWTFEKQSDGCYEIKANTTTGLNLDLSSPASGTALRLWADNNADGQRFQLTSLGGGYYRITPKISTAFGLDVAAASTADGADVIEYAWNSSSWNQQWLIVPVW